MSMIGVCVYIANATKVTKCQRIPKKQKKFNFTFLTKEAQRVNRDNCFNVNLTALTVNISRSTNV